MIFRRVVCKEALGLPGEYASRFRIKIGFDVFDKCNLWGHGFGIGFDQWERDQD